MTKTKTTLSIALFLLLSACSDARTPSPAYDGGLEADAAFGADGGTPDAGENPLGCNPCPAFCLPTCVVDFADCSFSGCE